MCSDRKMNDSFSEAVKFSKGILRNFVHDGKLIVPAAEPEEIVLKFCVPFIQVSDETGTYFLFPEGAAEWLVPHSENSRAAFDLLCHITASKIQRGEELTYPLRVFAALRVGPGLPSPAKASKRSVTFVANLLLLMTAHLLARNFDLSLTRNEASEPASACDAVSEALKELGHGKSWRAIKELIVHAKNEKLREEMNSLLKILEGLYEKLPSAERYFEVSSPWYGRDGDTG